MILTPEEQTEYREEIDYLIETRGFEYVWGKETVMDKTKALLRDAPGKIADGIQKIASNPTIIAMNEKAKQMNANLCEQESKRDMIMLSGGDAVHTHRERNPFHQQGKREVPDFQRGFDFGDDHL